MEHSFEMPKIDSIQPCVDYPIDDNQESSGALSDGDPNELNELKESDQTEESCQCFRVSYFFGKFYSMYYKYEKIFTFYIYMHTFIETKLDYILKI